MSVGLPQAIAVIDAGGNAVGERTVDLLRSTSAPKVVRMSPPRKRRIAARLRVAFVRLATTALALATLFGVLRAGATYVYCPMMERISDAPCCAADREHHSEKTGPELRTPDCCEHRVVAKLPPGGSVAKPTPSVTAPLLATVPVPAEVVATALPLVRGRVEHEGRAGPIVRSRHRAELMVFLN
ncbi:MAG: hypothetical protein KIT84_11150 [Labilithrix sp.]|nr:hypothetical protein [Labilithrix sp.]MCW5811565.1 hypothetical protein [Labilithrix sp.]